MNAADLARLELAKRAFKATQPGDAEVQTGVRRARLAIGRAKPHRRWFSKGLVFVVLAVGSLAYAKPQALAELVENVRPREAADAGTHVGRGPTNEPVEAALRLGGVKPTARHARHARPTTNAAPAPAEDRNGMSAASAADAAAKAQSESLVASASARAEVRPLKKATAAAAAAPPTAALSPSPAASAAESAESAPTRAVSDWGRVGQALARGDDSAALAALNGLSESDDQRTRDKADLGRAQLLMAHGDPDKACALARSLTHRRAGGRIERQAQLLLKGCGR